MLIRFEKDAVEQRNRDDAVQIELLQEVNMMTLAAITPKMTAMRESTKNAKAIVRSMTTAKSALIANAFRSIRHSISVGPTRRITVDSAATGIHDTYDPRNARRIAVTISAMTMRPPKRMIVIVARLPEPGIVPAKSAEMLVIQRETSCRLELC